MDLWMKSIWVLAALAVITCLVALGGSAGIGDGPAYTPTTMEYFTVPNPARGSVDYVVRDGKSSTIYNSLLAR
jgi:hypothetical protein